MEEFDDLYVRNLGDLKSVLKFSKINVKNITNVSQALYYPSNEGENLKLIELDKDLLAELENGKKLYFKGGLKEQVILCSSEKCYEVKAAEISNSLLVLPDLKLPAETSKSPLKKSSDEVNKSLDRSLEDDDENMEEADINLDIEIEDKQILKIFYEYYELREIKPKLKKIYDLLKLTPYAGAENEHSVETKHLFSHSQLLRTIQCSENEFNEALAKFRCLEIDEKLRILENSYEFRVLSLMLGIFTENSWKLDEVDKDVTMQSLDGIVPETIASQLFDHYTTKNFDTGKYEYRQELVASVVATNILQNGLKFQIEDFLNTWQEALPEGFITKDQYLSGIGIIDRESNPPCVRSLLEEDLPTNILDRLKVLFKTKERWSLEQIAPYIETFCTPKLSVTSILAKHARSLVSNGTRYYVSKH